MNSGEKKVFFTNCKEKKIDILLLLSLNTRNVQSNYFKCLARATLKDLPHPRPHHNPWTFSKPFGMLLKHTLCSCTNLPLLDTLCSPNICPLLCIFYRISPLFGRGNVQTSNSEYVFTTWLGNMVSVEGVVLFWNTKFSSHIPHALHTPHMYTCQFPTFHHTPRRS